MSKLQITATGTIKGEDIYDKTIDEFVDMINSNINKTDIEVYDGMSFDIEYNANVYHDKQGYLVNLWGNNYEIDASGFEYLDKKLDEFSKITQKHFKEKEIIDAIESNEELGKEKSKEAVKYLQKAIKAAKNKIKRNIISYLKSGIFLYCGIGIFTLMFLFQYEAVIYTGIVFALPLTLIGSGLLADKFMGTFGEIKKCQKFSKQGKKKIAELSHDYARGNSKIAKKAMEDDEEYKNPVVKTIYNIEAKSSALGREDRQEVIVELKDILENYIKGLKENGNSDEIVKESFKRLRVLNDKVDKLISNINERHLIRSENEKLRKAISDEVEKMAANEGEVMTSSGGVARK